MIDFGPPPLVFPKPAIIRPDAGEIANYGNQKLSSFGVTPLSGFGAGGDAYTAYGGVFDGSNDYLSWASSLTGLADGKEFTFSCWFKFDSTLAASAFCLLGLDNSANTAQIRRRNPTQGGELNALFVAGGTVLDVDSITSWDPPVDNNWHHWFLSVDMTNSSNRYFYIDGSAYSVSWNTYSNSTLDLEQSGAYVGDNDSHNSKWDGEIAEIWFDDVYYDAPTYIDKFISGGKPVDLGSDGSAPTGSQPVIYIHIGGPDGTRLLNLGSAGDPTETGSIANGTLVEL